MDLGVTVGDSLDRLERTVAGFDFAELSIDEGAHPSTDAVHDRLRGAPSKVGLCVHLPFDQVVATPVSALNDAIVDYLGGLLEWAGTVGARKAVLHGTMRNPHDTARRSVFAEQLSAVANAGADAGIQVVVENVGHQARGVPLSVLGDIARETGTAVCFDVGHAYMEAENDGIDRFLGEHADLVSHLHVHDVRGRGDTHMPLGAGEVEFDVVGEHLSGFDGTVAVEVFTDDVPLLEDTAHRIEEHLA